MAVKTTCCSCPRIVLVTANVCAACKEGRWCTAASWCPVVLRGFFLARPSLLFLAWINWQSNSKLDRVDLIIMLLYYSHTLQSLQSTWVKGGSITFRRCGGFVKRLGRKFLQPAAQLLHVMFFLSLSICAPMKLRSQWTDGGEEMRRREKKQKGLKDMS